MEEATHVNRAPVGHAVTKLEDALAILRPLAVGNVQLERVEREVTAAVRVLDQAIAVADGDDRDPDAQL